ncbi:MAG: hypothetical protein JXN65_03345 [Clostridia bacterium]|nr:hypothetical protein [Clostridia bacterium]
MSKKYLYIIAAVFILASGVLSGCSNSGVRSLDDEAIETFEVIKADGDDSSAKTYSAGVGEKLTTVGFYAVSGVFSRNVMQEDAEVMEMFAADQNSFLRIFENDLEREVYAYNYVSDEFTYLYYFDGERVAKTVINVSTGNVVEDDSDYAPLLTEDAAALKAYFYEIIGSADITVSELAAE